MSKRGRYLDDWTVGEEILTPGRTMTETDIVMFAAMSGDYNQLHTNADYMKDDPQFGQRIGHGLLGLAISHGLLTRTGFLEETAIAFLGVDEWKFQGPIFIGDTVHVKAVPVTVKPSSSKPDRGILKLKIELVNQNGQAIQSGFQTLMVHRQV